MTIRELRHSAAYVDGRRFAELMRGLPSGTKALIALGFMQHGVVLRPTQEQAAQLVGAHRSALWAASRVSQQDRRALALGALSLREIRNRLIPREAAAERTEMLLEEIIGVDCAQYLSRFASSARTEQLQAAE
jgi:hypothetical protein